MADAVRLDVRPPLYDWLVYQGDPLDLRIRLTVEGELPADVIGWAWSARINTSPPTDFECYPEDDGVTLYLRSEDSMNLIPGKWGYSFDVVGRDPLAGEGVTVLRGKITATRRVTRPLRGLAPA